MYWQTKSNAAGEMLLGKFLDAFKFHVFEQMASNTTIYSLSFDCMTKLKFTKKWHVPKKL